MNWCPMKKTINQIEDDLAEHDTAWAFKKMEEGHVVTGIGSNTSIRHWRLIEDKIYWCFSDNPVITWSCWLIHKGFNSEQYKRIWMSTDSDEDRYEIVDDQKDQEANQD